ncbi:hypothetical protein K788_0007548 [Paraburkholderia caribensis MBA4]|uniref:Uncharacterized protein n=1 Tax=Paraburkholderia caribensis MBA4 TaxID=1323664 RepID=A0A0P0RKH3_9BURK|nr:hypothetical protein K788_0007548 [Paraburkholderia caribensis MBA4]
MTRRRGSGAVPRDTPGERAALAGPQLYRKTSGAPGVAPCPHCSNFFR